MIKHIAIYMAQYTHKKCWGRCQFILTYNTWVWYVCENNTVTRNTVSPNRASCLTWLTQKSNYGQGLHHYVVIRMWNRIPELVQQVVPPTWQGFMSQSSLCQAVYGRKSIVGLNQTFYSLDMAPNYFWLFPKLKSTFKEQKTSEYWRHSEKCDNSAEGCSEKKFIDLKLMHHSMCTHTIRDQWRIITVYKIVTINNTQFILIHSSGAFIEY
jgi:hypothetical protein